MKLKTSDIMNLFQALHDLDGTAEKQFKFSGMLTLDIAVNIQALRPIAVSIERAKGAIVANFSGGRGQIKLDDPQYGEFRKAIDLFDDLERDVQLHLIKRGSLQLDTNAIRMVTIANLLPIIIDEDKK